MTLDEYMRNRNEIVQTVLGENPNDLLKGFLSLQDHYNNLVLTCPACGRATHVKWKVKVKVDGSAMLKVRWECPCGNHQRWHEEVRYK